MIRTSIANYTGVDPHPWVEPDQRTIPTYLPIYRSLHICNTNFIETFKQHFTEDWYIEMRNKIHNEAMFALMYVTAIFNNESLFGENHTYYEGIKSRARSMTNLRQFYMRIVDTDDFKNFIEPYDISR